MGGARERVRALDQGQSTAPAAGDLEQAARSSTPALARGQVPLLPALYGDRATLRFTITAEVPMACQPSGCIEGTWIRGPHTDRALLGPGEAPFLRSPS